MSTLLSTRTLVKDHTYADTQKPLVSAVALGLYSGADTAAARMVGSCSTSFRRRMWNSL